MKQDLRRPLGMLGIVGFAAVAGVLSAWGHTPVAISLIAAAAAFAAVMSFGSRRRDRQAARRLADLAADSRRIKRRLTRSSEKIAARDQRRAERDQRLTERMEEMERRLLASFEAERLRAAQRHRELTSHLAQPPSE